VAVFHLAGIIPIDGQRSDFDLPWHSSLLPIAPGYLAVERAVVECAYAGCKTIWIVCGDDIEPLIRYQIGDYVKDPVCFNRSKYSKVPKNEKKEIPIFYIPTHPKDRSKRDCLSNSILYGALSAYHVSNQISKWLKPKRYYVAFPYSVYSPEVLRPHRKDISSPRGFYFSYEGKTVKDGEYLGFTFDEAEYKKYREVIRKGTGTYVAGQKYEKGRGPTEKLSIEERWSAKNFTLKEVFGDTEIKNSKIVELDWYYNIDNWDKYCYYMGSSESVKRPSKHFLSYGEFNEMGVDNDENI
tara:strand:+ start:2188 stop:3078 length:891 start_codon:yes stop_codon:yes gene_type:complete